MLLDPAFYKKLRQFQQTGWCVEKIIIEALKFKVAKHKTFFKSNGEHKSYTIRVPKELYDNMCELESVYRGSPFLSPNATLGNACEEFYFEILKALKRLKREKFDDEVREKIFEGLK